MGLRYQPPFRALLAIGALATLCALFCASTAAFSQPSKSPKSKKSNTAKPQATPGCQSPNSILTQTQLSEPSSQTIVLSWNASVPSPEHPDKAVGYCLYRSLTKGDAKLEAKCRKCQLLTPKPLTGTSCVDNAVTAGPTYYYVVAAVNGGGMSGPSNEAFASLQTGKSASGPPKDIPSCGGKNSSEGTAARK